jgi:hypothetical protein
MFHQVQGMARSEFYGDGGAFRSYKGTLDCFKTVLAREGVKGLYKGWVLSVFKAAPTTGVTFAVYERALKQLGQQEY